MKPFYLAIITILLAGFAFLSNQATSDCIIFCQVDALQPTFLQIDKNIYLKGDIVLLYGSIGNYTQGYNVTAKIFDNQGNVVLTQVIHPKQDSTFLLRIPTNESDWKTGGPYDLKVWYGSCCYIGDHTFTFYTDHLPPLKQEEAEIAFWNIKCNANLALMMKQEDGSVACVRPDSLQKLISLKWGYDPSEKLTTYGLKDIYRTGQEIDFKFRINGFGNRCEQPTVTVRNSDQKIMWQSSQYATGCANGLDTGNVKDEAYLGRESHLGYDYNQYGPLIINQTGTYFVNISWLDGNITKEFSIIPSTVQQTSGNATLPYSFMQCDIPYPQNGTGIAVLYIPVNSTGKICVQYSNSNPPQLAGLRIFEAHHIEDDTKDVTSYATPDKIQTGNSIIVYTVKTTNHVGFYGLTIFCVGMPLAVGYDSTSTFVQGDFPWLGGTHFCPAQLYNYHIVGLSGIGIKYIPYH